MVNHTLAASSDKTVLFLTLAYYPTIGGAEKQAQSLAERWAASGRSVVVLTRRLPGAPHQEQLNGVKIVRLPALWLPGLAWVTFTLSALGYLIPRVRRISCTVALLINAASLTGVLLACLFNIPLLIKPSAGGRDGNVQTVRRSLLGRLKLSWILGTAAYIVAINEEIVSELVSIKIPRRKIRLIPNGVDTRRFFPIREESRPAIRESLKVDLARPMVLFVGRLEPVKNLDGLVQAWASVIREVPEAQLLIVGDGSDRQRIETRIRQSALEASIRLLGSRNELKPLYQAADLFILPSFREGISNALLEAMACGVVPVASRVGGNRDILSEEFPELLVDPQKPGEWHETLVPLLKDAERRKTLGRRIRRRAEQAFSSDLVERKYRVLIESSVKPIFQRSFPILAYHRVLPEPVYGVDTRLSDFEAQMSWLAAEGYHTISLETFNSLWKGSAPWPKKTIVITFDDGHREFYDHAVPVLKRLGFTATLFINTGLLGRTFWVEGRRPSPVTWHDHAPSGYDEKSPSWRRYNFMSWEQVEALAREGFEIGSHAVTHCFLTDLNAENLQRELEESKKSIEERLGTTVRFFCYPSGDYNADVQTAVAKAGYVGAVQTPGHDHLAFYWDDPWAWERVGIWQDVSFWKFKALVKGWYVYAFSHIPESLWVGLRSIFRLLNRSS